MNFFERQHLSKRNTRKLVFLFCVVMVIISFTNHFVISIVCGSVMTNLESGWLDGERVGWMGFILHYLLNLKNALIITICTAAIIILLAVYKYYQLREGGVAVAEMMGGRRVDAATQDIHERKLMNVVEEMSIASSVPVPAVYIFDKQRGINAFAAGYTVDDCAIGVTEGCTRLLTRDELQGVIAHEFSHILNHDMRLNLRLVVFVYGLVIIALLGRSIIEGSEEASDYMSSDEGDVVGGAASIIGYIIYAFGAFGAMMATLVKCAVSREREYLADASAVQFTRNPEAFSGALKKIAAWDNGSRVNGAHASELSHMFFGSGLENEEGSLGDTHPPVHKRIKLITPSFDGDLSAVRFPEYPNHADRERGGHLSGKSILWVEGNAGVSEIILDRLSKVKDLNVQITVDLSEVRSLISSKTMDYVVVNTGAVDWFSGRVLDEFILPSEAMLIVMASDSTVNNALDALESEEREVVEKPVSRENLPFQLHPVTDRFNCHFMGWYGVFLCRSRDDQVGITPEDVDPVSPVINQAGIPVMVGASIAVGQGGRRLVAPPVEDLIGAPKPEHIDFAVRIVRSLPGSIRDAVHDTHDSCGLVFGLLTEREQGAVRQFQLQVVRDHFGDYMANVAERFSGEIETMDSRAKLPVVDLAIRSLRQLSEVQFVSFRHVIDELVAADESIDLFEYSLSKLIVRHLEPHFSSKKPPVIHIYSLKKLGRECSVLISSLANVAGGDPESIQAAFYAGKIALKAQVDIDYIAPSEASFVELDEVLSRLNTIEGALKRTVVKAAAAAVAADGYLQRQEAELLRAICDGIGCPIPPLAVSLEEAA